MEHVQVIKILLDSGVNPNINDKDGNPILLLMARRGNLEMIKLFIEHNGDIHLKDQTLKNALHFSAFYGHFELTKYLVSVGVNYKAESNRGKTPLKLAEEQGSPPELVSFLREVEKK